MARLEFDGFDGLEAQLAEMDRNMIKGIVMAGADACTKEMQNMIGSYRHVRTGSMQQHVAPAQYHESLNSGWVDVYPQGTDDRGVSNALKAFVINYGIGKNPTRRSGGKVKNKTGDKFITGNQKRMERGVFTAMQAESDRQIAQLNK